MREQNGSKNYKSCSHNCQKELIGKKKDDTRIMCYLYKATKFKGEIKSNDEGQIKWLTKNELLNKNNSYPKYIAWALEKV